MAKFRRRSPFVDHNVLLSLIVGVIFVGLVALIPILSAQSSTLNLSDFARAASGGQVKLGIMSDSSTDEYRANDARGGSYGTTTLNWAELLVKYRGIDLGPWGTRPEPRRTGFEFNWARTGAQARDLVTSGQPAGVANLVSTGRVNVVYLGIGNNDFAYYRDGAKIYDGSLSGAALESKLTQFSSDVRSAYSTVRAAGNVPIIIATVGDPNLVASSRAKYPDAQKQARVKSAVDRVNAQIRAIASSDSNVIIFDQDAFGRSLLSRVDSSGNLIIGGEKISVVRNCDEPHCGILGDGIHGGTVMGGVLANEVIKYLNEAVGAGILPFTDNEILIASGIKSGIVATPVPATSLPTVRPTSTPNTLPTCAVQGGVCRAKSGVCGDGAYTYAPNSDCSPTQNCCVPVVTPVPTVRPTSTPRPTPIPPSGTAKRIKLVHVSLSARASYSLFDGIIEDGVQTDVNSSRFSYAGSWLSDSRSGVNNSVVRYTKGNGASVEFTTTARQLLIQTARHPFIGALAVYVDGVFQQRITLTAPVLSFEQIEIEL